MNLKLVFIVYSLLSLTSCSSLMNSIYKDFDQQERLNSNVDSDVADGFDQYRNTKRRSSTQYNKVDRMVTTNNEKQINPAIKRQYKPEKEVAKRYTASDLTDNGNDGSLWAGSDPNAFLFSNNKNKASGDIVQISVLARLKNEITMELKKAFPENPFDARASAEAKQGDPKSPDGATEKGPAKKDAVADATATDAGIDKISGVVVEEINREHLLIKGRKNVLYKNRKRMVEVQALVSRKDIGENDTVSSDAILESNVSVVR
jgi:flagellar L-ring protein precursor FlgH